MVTLRQAYGRAVDAYRRTGADVPFGDPRPTHGAEMEGWFWRFTDASSGSCVIALCGVNRAAGGDWATVAVARHPGGEVWSVAAPTASASADRYRVQVADVLVAGPDHLAVHLPGADLQADLRGRRDWVGTSLHGGGVFSVLPRLGQYWHPHVLGGTADVALDVAGDGRLELGAATVYAEKNWGAGFPDRWWWGQAHDFTGADGRPPDGGVCVAFGGGALRAGPVTGSVTGAVVRVGDRVLRFSPPGALVRASASLDGWHVDARTPRRRLVLRGGADGTAPHVLPVPVPAERRNVDADLEHLAGRLELELHERGRPALRAASPLAGLEIGSLVDPLPLPVAPSA